jgi:putative membrane-bound dehydrogenase-like protein
MRVAACLAFFLLLLVPPCSPALARAQNPPPPVGHPGLAISLWAAEPRVVDPVAIAWDHLGRAWVAECRDYPYGVGPGGQTGSAVRCIEDRDGDGAADRSVVFAEGLSYVTSVLPWRDGVLVAAPPDILFLRDTNHDGVADQRDVILTGFRRGVSDSLVNGLRFGLDGRVHGANGGNGGRLSSPKRPGVVLDLGDDDFAFDPDTGVVERTGASGGGFGLVMDDWGRFFTTYNIDHIQHRFMNRADVEGRVGFPTVPLTGSISDHEDMARIFPVSIAVTRPNHPEQAGHFSAAGGMGRVASLRWPAPFQDSVFVCDVVGNLVHRDVLHPRGAAFVASRAPDESRSEFIASADPAFRPVGLEMGPDGALYLLDMQRDVIEHPDYIPAKVREKLDVRAGADRGRIWRVVPRQGTWGPEVAAARMDWVSADGVRCLEHPDQWWRLTAQRRIIEAKAVQLVPDLRRMLARRDAVPAHALGRIHALWTLRSLSVLTEADVVGALSDPVAGVRENALHVMPKEAGSNAVWMAAVRGLVADPDARVRQRALLALARSSLDEAPTFLAAFQRDAADPWVRRAILAAAPAGARVAVAKAIVLDARRDGIPGGDEATSELAQSIAADGSVPTADMASLLRVVSPAMAREARMAWLGGWWAGLQRSGRKNAWPDDLKAHWSAWAGKAEDDEWAILWRVARTSGMESMPGVAERMAGARGRALDAGLPPSRRVAAVRVLEGDGDSTETLLGLLDGLHPGAVQEAALAALREVKDPAMGRALVERWPRLGPGVRPRAINLILSRRNFHEPLVAALEAGRVKVGDLNLDLEQRRRLLRDGPAEVRQRAARWVQDEEYSHRKSIVSDWLARLPSSGDAAKGRGVFEASCATCHRCADVGHRVGPDLSGVAHRSVEDLLGNILDPNMAINPGFVAYQAETRDGETHAGLLSAEGPDSITLLQAAGQTVVLPRRDVVRLASTGASLMPEGLEAGRTPQDLRDLIEFLQSAR